jgi:hypothetical protein
MRTYIAFLFLACLWGCRQGINHILVIPVSIPSDGSTRHVPGTGLALHLPPGFRLDSAHQAAFEDSQASIRIVYTPGQTLLSPVAVLRKEAADSARLNREQFYNYQHFSQNDVEEDLYYTKSGTAGKDKLTLFLDNQRFSAAAVAEFPADQAAIRDSVLRSLLSLREDLSTPADIADMEPFTLDLSNSEFAYCNHAGMAFFYTIGGTPNPDFLASADQLMVLAPLPKPGVDLRERVMEVIRLYTQTHLRVQVYSVHKTYVRENPAYEAEGNIRNGDKVGKLYVLAMGNVQNTLILAALLYEDVNRRLDEVIGIGRSLQFKNRITN